MTTKPCSIPDCDMKPRRRDATHGTVHLRKGLCDRHYTQSRYGHRATVQATCIDCGVAFGTYVADGRCPQCRAHHKRRVPDPICPTCGTVFKRKGGRDKFCDPACNPKPRIGGRSMPAYRKAVRDGDRIAPRVVFDRDKWQCHLCGEKVNKHLEWPHPLSASLDHVRPISKGGTHTYFNVRLAHLVCNERKGPGR